MTKKFFIFRHGQTNFNLQGRYQGQKFDLPLNERGIQQAYGLSCILSAYNLDCIYTSPMLRSYQTAKIVAQSTHIPVIKEEGFIAGNYGMAEGQFKRDLKEKYGKEFVRWRSTHKDDLDFRFYGAETKREMQERMVETLRMIASSTDYTKIGVATHGGMIRSLFPYFGKEVNDLPNGYVLSLSITTTGELTLF